MLLIELVAERMKQDPIPIGLLGVLTMVWYLEIEALLSWFQFN